MTKEDDEDFASLSKCWICDYIYISIYMVMQCLSFFQQADSNG